MPRDSTGTRKEGHPDWETSRHKRGTDILAEHTGAGGQTQRECPMHQGPGGRTAVNQPDGVEGPYSSRTQGQHDQNSQLKSPGSDRLPNFWIKQFKSLSQAHGKKHTQKSRTWSKLQTS